MHGANYRRGNGQPYARKKYIKGKPQIKIAKFQSGKPDNYDYCVQLLVNENVQIRHMAIEAARLSANKTIEKVAGENGYQSRLRTYPHVLLRENKMIATAGLQISDISRSACAQGYSGKSRFGFSALIF